MISKIGFKAVILLGLLQTFSYVDAQISNSQCGQCGPFFVRCINEKDFYFCIDGMNSTQPIQTCGDDQYCTNSRDVCVDRANVNVADLPCTPCNACPTTQILDPACISETEYTRCANGNPLPIEPITCPSGQVCNNEFFKITGEICAPQMVLEFFNQTSATCSNAGSNPNSPPAIEAPPSDMQQRMCRIVTNPTGKYYYTRNVLDSTCRTYIYCEPGANGSMSTLFFTCPSGFFDETQQRCVADRPASCQTSN